MEIPLDFAHKVESSAYEYTVNKCIFEHRLISHFV